MNMKKIGKIAFKVLMLLIGFAIGFVIMSALMENDVIIISNKYVRMTLKIIASLILAIISFLLSGRVGQLLKNLAKEIEIEISKKPLYEIIFSSLGLVIGLLIAFLLTQMISIWNLGIFGSIISLALYILFGYLGIALTSKNKDSLLNMFSKDHEMSLKPKSIADKKAKGLEKKVLDTSAIIDGRILEIAKTDFLEGPLVLPIFILEELQHIADSSDSLKRNRGRRGLEVINNLQNLENIEVIILDKKYPEILEVDSKLVKLALDEGYKIITNDFNLNKVAKVQGIKVLNINELANALKPIAIPGETMYVQIIKEGQEQGQGIAYLDDGTMIVIENGKDLIGQAKEVIVTSVLQTNAGKMIFAKVK